MVLCYFFFFGDLCFSFFNLIQRLINNKTYEEKKKQVYVFFGNGYDKDLLVCCAPGRFGVLNFEDFFGRFGS